MQSVTLKIAGMSCAGCVNSVERVVRAIPGVAGVRVSLEDATAAIDYDPERTGTAAFKSAIEEAGYEVVA